MKNAHPSYIGKSVLNPKDSFDREAHQSYQLLDEAVVCYRRGGNGMNETGLEAPATMCFGVSPD